MKQGISFTNFARVEFECMFSFVSVVHFLTLTFSMSLRSIYSVTLVPGYKPCENNDNIMKQ